MTIESSPKKTLGVFGALAVGSFDFILLAYPFYIIIANYSIVTAILLGKNRNTR